MNFKHLNAIIITLSLIFLVLIIYISSIIIKDYPPQDINEINNLTVTRVIDGDTFFLYNREIVRLLCVDTPEEGKEGYEDAKVFLESLILNKEVRLESDLEDKDKYNRSLRYVYTNISGNELFINKEIVKYGLGKVFPYGNSTRLCDEISSR